MKVLDERLKTDELYGAGLTNNDIKDGVNLCLTKNIFGFHEQYFEQTRGLPMENPLSSVMTNLVMEYIADKILSSPPHFILVWKWYVDDVLAVVELDTVIELLDYLNSVHSRIVYTLGREHWRAPISRCVSPKNTMWTYHHYCV